MQLADIFIAQEKDPADRTPEEAEAIAEIEAVDAVKSEVGMNDNARAFLVAKVVLELAAKVGHTSKNVTELARINGVVDTAPDAAKAAILGG